MSSLIEHIISIKDDKELLTKIWCCFQAFVYPDVLPQEYKPEWWQNEPQQFTWTALADKGWEEISNYGLVKELEGKKWGFGDPIQQYIETIVPKAELIASLKEYFHSEHGISLDAIYGTTAP